MSRFIFAVYDENHDAPFVFSKLLKSENKSKAEVEVHDLLVEMSKTKPIFDYEVFTVE